MKSALELFEEATLENVHHLAKDPGYAVMIFSKGVVKIIHEALKNNDRYASLLGSTSKLNLSVVEKSETIDEQV